MTPNKRLLSQNFAQNDFTNKVENLWYPLFTKCLDEPIIIRRYRIKMTNNARIRDLDYQLPKHWLKDNEAIFMSPVRPNLARRLR